MLIAYEKLINLAINSNLKDLEEFKKLKRSTSKEFGLSLFRNENIRNHYLKMVRQNKIKKSKNLEELLVLKKTRSLSGVAVVAALTKDYPCKNDCLYCPSEAKMPKSYLSNEPAVMRAIRLNFNPYHQVKKRIEVLAYNGHNTSKLELIIMGGTFSHLPEKYQYWFILNCYKAANDFSLKKKKKQKSHSIKLKKQALIELIKQEKKKNITAKKRIVGLTLETRPDTINLKELTKYRFLGCTRVEIGVQSIDDKVLELNQRGHDTKTTIKATKLLKNLGFKINYHLMPGLYGSNFKKDLQMFKDLFLTKKAENFQPDMLKIYPCVVNEYAELYELWQKKKYRPYTNQELEKLIIEIKKIIPPYVRITRLIRDIPTSSISAGPDIPNLRQILQNKKIVCRCIRCREIGRVPKNKDLNLKLNRLDYKASGGQEIFLEFISSKKNNLHAFLRLRIPSNPKNPSIKELKNASIIREIHSYGMLAPVGQKLKDTSQHKGLGKKLIKEAEKITKQEFKLKKTAVIAAEGTKEYYRKLGFRDKGLYMVKPILEGRCMQRPSKIQ
jgi:elongator complex protein 3